MNSFTKTCVSLVALIGYSTAATAASISSPGAGATVTASGELTQDLNGTLTTVCDVVLTGTVDSDLAGITFASYTGTTVSGPLACNDGLVFPLQVKVADANHVTIKNMTVSTRLGNCGPADVTGPWVNGSPSTAGPLAASLPGTSGLLSLGGVCHASGSLAVDATIN